MNWKNRRKFKFSVESRKSFVELARKSVRDAESDDFIEKLRFKEALIDSLLHELRSINGDLKDSLDQVDFKTIDRRVVDKIVDIWAKANLLSIRMQMYDFEVNPQVFAESGRYDIPVFRRVEKIYKCLDKAHFRKHIKINLIGKSFLIYEASDILEIAFYIILHNAIKYAPEKSQIDIEFIELGNTLKVIFSNEAYLPSKDEIHKLTERGYRGVNARNGNISGSGIGLYTLRKICLYQDVQLNINTIGTPPLDNKGIFKVTLTFPSCKQAES